MSDRLKLFLQKAFDIREGEYGRAFLMQFYIFLIISTLLIVKPTVNALFLSRFGVENLPFAFILVAIVAGFVSTLYARILTILPLDKIISGTFIFSVLSLILFTIILRLNFFENFILYLFYIWVAIFALLTTSQFWVMANIVFNAREAKRLFGFVGAGAIAGGIFGGYLTSLLAQVMGSEFLPLVSAGLLVLCIPIARKIWNENVKHAQTQFQQKKKTTVFGDHPFNLIRQSRHLTYLACIVGTSVMVAKLVDYQFGGIAASLIPDADELTAFFGFWYSTFNVISLFLQLFLTRKIVGTFGVGTSLFFLPLLILLATIVLLIAPEVLMAAVFLKMSDGSLKQSVNKAAMELLILPLPVTLKKQTKTFIDVFVDSLATGIIGLILIFLVKGLDLSTHAINWMIIGLLLLWLFFANQVRKEYLQTFKANLTEKNPAYHPKEKFNLSRKSVLNGLEKVLANGKEQQILFVLSKTRELNNKRFFDKTRLLLNHSSRDVRTEALHNLYYYPQDISAQVERLTRDESQKVKIAAFEYLMRHSLEDKITLINRYLEEKDDKISGAALVSIAKETRNNSKLKQQLGVEKIIRAKLDAISRVNHPVTKKNRTLSLLKAIGYANIPSFYSTLTNGLMDDDPEIINHSIIAAGKTLSPIFIDDLIGLLAIKKFKNNAIQALVNYGRAIVDLFKQKLKEDTLKIKNLRVVPSVVKQVGAQRSVNFLFELFDHPDHVVQLEALRGLNLLHNQHPHLKFNKKNTKNIILIETRNFQHTLSALYVQNAISNSEKNSPDQKDARASLINLLEKELDRNLERIFRLLGLKYASDDMLVVYKGLNNNKPDFRSNAIEFLDNLLEPSLRRILIPIVETAMIETITENAILNLTEIIPNELQCFQRLLEGRDLRIKIAVLYLIAQLSDQKYLLLAKRYTNHDHEKIRNFAQAAVMAMEKM